MFGPEVDYNEIRRQQRIEQQREREREKERELFRAARAKRARAAKRRAAALKAKRIAAAKKGAATRRRKAKAVKIAPKPTLTSFCHSSQEDRSHPESAGAAKTVEENSAVMEQVMDRETPLPIGTRVVAVSHNEGKKLFVFGHGVFEGYFIPPKVNLPEQLAEIQKEYAVQQTVIPDLPKVFTEQEAMTALLLSESNPRIKLDNGEVVWGYECWWGDEPTFEKKSVGYEVVTADVMEMREANEKLAAMEDQFRAAILSAANKTGE